MPEMIDFLLGTGAIGVVFGVMVAALFRSARHPYFWAGACAFLGATLLVALGGVVWMSTSALQSGYRLPESIIMGIVFTQSFWILAPFSAGVPALLASLAAQCLIQRERKLPPNPPPSPPSEGNG